MQVRSRLRVSPFAVPAEQGERCVKDTVHRTVHPGVHFNGPRNIRHESILASFQQTSLTFHCSGNSFGSVAPLCPRT